MPPACPQCGTHLNITLCSVDSTDTIILTRAQPPHEPEAPPAPLPPNTPPPPYPSSPLPIGQLPTLESDLHHPSDPTFPNAVAPLQRLKCLLCPCPCSGPDAHVTRRHHLVSTLRPYLCRGTAGQLRPGRPHAALHRTAAKMQATISRCGAGSADVLLAARREGTAMVGGRVHDEEEGLVFEALGAVVYDMEWTAREEAVEHAELLADSAYAIGPRLKELLRRGFVRELFELMLLVDYGSPAYPLHHSLFSCDGPRHKFPPGIRASRSTHERASDPLWCLERFCGMLTATAWRWRQGHGLPDQEAWSLIRDVLLKMELCPRRELRGAWDTAAMFYFYYSHRKPLGDEAHMGRWTGYTGVLQEMVDEIPLRGTDRLTRKLSLDIYFFIPLFIRDQALKEWAHSRAWETADRHGCPVVRPKTAQEKNTSRAVQGKADTPPVSASTWWDLRSLAWLVGLELPRQRLEDEERGGRPGTSEGAAV